MKNERCSYNKRLGELLIELGSLRDEHINQLLDLQDRDCQAGVRSKFGELCVRTGKANAREVTAALGKQKQDIINHVGLSDMLISLGFLKQEQLDTALERRVDIFEPLGEIVVDQGFCTHDQVKIANQLLAIQQNNALREKVSSNFVPFNIMELLVCEQIDEVMSKDGNCQCSQCWSNIFSVALNELPSRYVSEHGRIQDFLNRFQRDYDELVRQKLELAVQKVRANPKASCMSKFSDELLSQQGFQGDMHGVIVHVSNHHVHLSQEDVERLFGAGYQLTKLKDLVQPGQYAARECVTLVGPKGELERVRVLGPPRQRTQVEISGTDQFLLGIQVPVKESGNLEGTPGIRLRGTIGEIEIKSGTIRALRHVHMLPEDAERMGLKNGDMVSVRLEGDRSTIYEGVLIRATETSALEMHIDTDEANAAGLPAESMGQIMVPILMV